MKLKASKVFCCFLLWKIVNQRFCFALQPTLNGDETEDLSIHHNEIFFVIEIRNLKLRTEKSPSLFRKFHQMWKVLNWIKKKGSLSIRIFPFTMIMKMLKSATKNCCVIFVILFGFVVRIAICDDNMGK